MNHVHSDRRGRAIWLACILISSASCGLLDGLSSSDSDAGAAKGDAEGAAEAPAAGEVDGAKTPKQGDAEAGAKAETGAEPRTEAPAGGADSPSLERVVVERRLSDRCAIRGGQLWCWAPSWRAQAKQVSLPAKPVSVASDCALLETGAVMCVGKDGEPASEVPALKGAVAIDGRSRRMCGLVAGKVVCVDDGEVETVEGITDATDLAIESGFGCVIQASEVTCWGDNDRGQLGKPPGMLSSKNKPPRKVEGLTDVVELGTGWRNACARTKAGEVTCWGDNDNGEVGAGLDSIAPPTKIAGVSGATALAIDSPISCALVGDAPRCWGGPFTTSDALPGLPPGQTVTAVAGNCVMLADERVFCHGHANPDKHGTPTWTAKLPGARVAKIGAMGPIVLTDAGTLELVDPAWTQEIPELATLTGVQEFDVATDEIMTSLCVVTDAEGLRCWKRRQGTATEWPKASSPTKMTAVSSWRERACGVTPRGELNCWNDEDPPSVTKLGNALSKLVDVATGAHRCVADSKGQLRCFGSNDNGELGQANTKESSDQKTPKGVRSVAEVDTELFYTCARSKAGKVMCWGGEFPHDGKPAAPRDVGLDGAVQISVGENLSCARDETNEVWCWREYVDWEQEPATRVEVPPFEVPELAGALDVRVADGRVCAALPDEVRCWWSGLVEGPTLPFEVEFD